MRSLQLYGMRLLRVHVMLFKKRPSKGASFLSKIFPARLIHLKGASPTAALHRALTLLRNLLRNVAKQAKILRKVRTDRAFSYSYKVHKKMLKCVEIELLRARSGRRSRKFESCHLDHRSPHPNPFRMGASAFVGTDELRSRRRRRQGCVTNRRSAPSCHLDNTIKCEFTF